MIPKRFFLANRQEAFFLAALLLIAHITVAAALAYRFGYSLTVDEPFMANMVRLPWRQLWSVFPIDNVPFAYVALKGWTAVFGESEQALRSFSAVAYGGAVIFTGLAARRAAGAAAGLAAAVLVAASDRIGLEYAATARPYALLALVAAVALWLSIRLLSRSESSPGRPTVWTVALCLAHFIGLLTHPTYVVIVGASVAASLVAERPIPSSVLVGAAAAALAYSVLWGPIVHATITLQTTAWMRSPTAADVQRAYTLIWGLGPGLIIAGALLAALLSSPARASELLRDPASRWMIAAAICSWIIPIAVSSWKPIFEATRTPVMLLPLTSAAISIVLVRSSGRTVALAVAVVCVIAATRRIEGRPAVDPNGARAGFDALLGQVQCGDTVIAPGVSSTSAEYYFRRMNAPTCIRLVAFPADFRAVFANWPVQLRDQSRVKTLEAEAAEIASAAATRRQSIWLLNLTGWETQEATTMMETALTRVSPCQTRLPLKGPFFDGVLKCVPTFIPGISLLAVPVQR